MKMEKLGNISNQKDRYISIDFIEIKLDNINAFDDLDYNSPPPPLLIGFTILDIVWSLLNLNKHKMSA